MQIEIDTLIKNNTQNLVTKPYNKPVIKGCQVLTRKYNLDNSIKKYKARWVAKGFLQKYNINYKETFATTSKPTLIRLLLAIFAYLDQEIYAFNIKQAFPNATIDSEIYIELPKGFKNYILDKVNISSNNIVCKLNKALYGLKQAARQW